MTRLATGNLRDGLQIKNISQASDHFHFGRRHAIPAAPNLLSYKTLLNSAEQQKQRQEKCAAKQPSPPPQASEHTLSGSIHNTQ
jgi:hypothetical protein